MVSSAIIIASIGVGSAQATVAPLKRSVENFTQGPLDAVLSPFTTGQTTYRSIEAEGGSTAGKISLGTITYLGLLVMNTTASLFRTWTGLMEFPVGLGALAATPFTDKDPPPFFDMKATPALVDHPSDVFDVKFGAYHIGGNE